MFVSDWIIEDELKYTLFKALYWERLKEYNDRTLAFCLAISESYEADTYRHRIDALKDRLYRARVRYSSKTHGIKTCRVVKMRSANARGRSSN